MPALAFGAWASHTPGTYRYALLYFCVAVLVPALYVVWAVRTGRISDFHMANRRERVAPFVVSLVCGLSAWLLLMGVGAATGFVALVFAMLLQTLLLFLITLAWQVSVHTAVAASLVTFVCQVVGPEAMPLAGLIPLVAWARLYLGRHTRGPNGCRRLRRIVLFRRLLRPARHCLVGRGEGTRQPSIGRRARCRIARQRTSSSPRSGDHPNVGSNGIVDRIHGRRTGGAGCLSCAGIFSSCGWLGQLQQQVPQPIVADWFGQMSVEAGSQGTVSIFWLTIARNSHETGDPAAPGPTAWLSPRHSHPCRAGRYRTARSRDEKFAAALRAAPPLFAWTTS